MSKAEIKLITSKLSGDVAYRTSRLMENMAKLLAIRTPKDTWHAASNWIVSVGRPYVGVDGSKEAVSWAEHSQGLSKIREYKLSQGDVYLVNNVPYIMILNTGWSGQAPPGFIQIAVSEAAALTDAETG